MGIIGTEFGLVAPKDKQKIQPAALKKSGRLTAGFLTSAAASVGTDPKDLIANNTPRSTLTKTTPMTKPLSPAADAVLGAYMNNCGWLDGPLEKDYRCAAAVLRAAADQVVPDGPKPSANSDAHLMNWTKSLDQYYQRQQTRAEILAIAAELDAH
jgi:hypothetical protein